MTKSQNILQINNLYVNYGSIKVLHDVSLTINRNEVVSLIGSNGAGKTTLMKTISGTKELSQGDLIYKDNINITKTSYDKRVQLGIAQIPEGREIFKTLSVFDNLLLGSYTKTNKKEINEDIDFIYSKFPILQEKKDLPAGTLSGGQQQMLAIGRALMSRPDILLMDEPSMGLAPVIVEEIFDFIDELKKTHLTIFLVEQNSNFALSISDRAYVLENGKIVLEGEAKELQKNPKVKEAYLGI